VNARFQREQTSELTIITEYKGVELSLYDLNENFISKFTHKGNQLIVTHLFEFNKIYKVK